MIANPRLFGPAERPTSRISEPRRSEPKAAPSPHRRISAVSLKPLAVPAAPIISCISAQVSLIAPEGNWWRASRCSR